MIASISSSSVTPLSIARRRCPGSCSSRLSDEGGDGDQAAVPLREPGRSHTSPNNTSSVSSTSFGRSRRSVVVLVKVGQACAHHTSCAGHLGDPGSTPVTERHCDQGSSIAAAASRR